MKLERQKLKPQFWSNPNQRDDQPEIDRIWYNGALLDRERSKLRIETDKFSLNAEHYITLVSESGQTLVDDQLWSTVEQARWSVEFEAMEPFYTPLREPLKPTPLVDMPDPQRGWKRGTVWRATKFGPAEDEGIRYQEWSIVKFDNGRWKVIWRPSGLGLCDPRTQTLGKHVCAALDRLTTVSDRGCAKIADFGLFHAVAKLVNRKRRTKSGDRELFEGIGELFDRYDVKLPRTDLIAA